MFVAVICYVAVICTALSLYMALRMLYSFTVEKQVLRISVTAMHTVESEKRALAFWTLRRSRSQSIQEHVEVLQNRSYFA
jgi:hypothetical protein